MRLGDYVLFTTFKADCGPVTVRDLASGTVTTFDPAHECGTLPIAPDVTEMRLRAEVGGMTQDATLRWSVPERNEPEAKARSGLRVVEPAHE